MLKLLQHRRACSRILVRALGFGLVVGVAFGGDSSGQPVQTGPVQNGNKFVEDHSSEKPRSDRPRNEAPRAEPRRSNARVEPGKTPGHGIPRSPAQAGLHPLNQPRPGLLPPKMPASGDAAPTLSHPRNAFQGATMAQKPQAVHRQPFQSTAPSAVGVRTDGLRGQVPAALSLGGQSSSPRNNTVLNGTGMRHKP